MGGVEVFNNKVDVKGKNVQVAGDNANQTINPEPIVEKQSMFANKFFLAFLVLLVVIALSNGSINMLCNNKILSERSCRILLQDIIHKIIPIANSEDKK